MIRVFVHPLLFVFAGGAYFLGVYWEFVFLFLALILHEGFHTLVALVLGYRIRSVELLPYGGRIAIEPQGYGRIAAEILVLLAGPASHAFFLAIPSSWTEALFGSYASWWREIHIALLAFNLLPVFPLDGGQILRASLSAWISYRRSLYAVYGVGVGLVLAVAVFAAFFRRLPSLGLLVYVPFLIWVNGQGFRHAEEEFLQFLWRRYRFLAEVRAFSPLPLFCCFSSVRPLAVLQHVRRERYLHVFSSPPDKVLPRDVGANICTNKQNLVSLEEKELLARVFGQDCKG